MCFNSAGKSGAYYIEYQNGNRKLELKDIIGIKTGTFVIEEKDKVFQLHFNKLPEPIREFNLIQGDANFRRDYKYADFIGIKTK